jgi:hypothetical protein
MAVHWHTYRNGSLWGVAYLFDHAGDAIPSHRHNEPDKHNVIVLSGAIEIEGVKAIAGDIVDTLPEWHKIIALADSTRTLNLYLHGLPAGATGEYVSGVF